MKCKNCGHALYAFHSGEKIIYEHYTRYYRPFGLPYHTVKCYADVDGHYCGCDKPEPEEGEDGDAV